MDQQKQSMVELLSSNRNAIAKAFKFESGSEVSLAALIWTLAGRQTTAEQMRTSFNYLKSKTSAVSPERSTGKLALVSRMVLSGDDAAYLAEVQRIFDKVMEGRTLKTSSRFGTALLIANCSKTPEEADRLLERSQSIYKKMREAHPIITDDRDMTFATIVALADRDEDELLADAEECYQLLGKEYKLTDGRQSMANVLALSPLPPAQKVARVAELRAAFKAHKISIGWTSSHEYTMLAMLALDNRSADEIAADVAELSALIRKQKGFGDFSVDRAIRQLIAATISTYANGCDVAAVGDSVALALVQAIIDWYIYIVTIVVVL